MVRASGSTRRVSTVSTNWPGHSRVSAFGNSPFTRIVPVCWSTWLSTKDSLPSAVSPRVPAMEAVTGKVPVAIAARIAGRCLSGTLKATLIGRSWVSVTSGLVSAARTMVPTFAFTVPVRPSIGAVMRVKLSETLAASIAARSAFTVPSRASAVATAAS